MTWAAAFFSCFALLVLCASIVFLVVYIKEYAREERIIKEFGKSSKQLQEDLYLPTMYLVEEKPAKTKKSKDALPALDSEKESKNKKDVN